MKHMTTWIKVVTIIFGALSAILLIGSIIFPEQGPQHFMLWFRMTAALQLFLVLVCLWLVCKLEKFRRLREENEKLKFELEQNGGMK